MSYIEMLIQQVGEEEFRRAVTCSVVGLGYTAKKSDSSERTYQHTSGFLLTIEDTWYFVTAGHVFTYKEKLKHAGYSIGQWHFDDSAGWTEKERRIPPPFTFTNEDTFVYETDEGHDYGAIRIKPFHRRELEANEKVALTEHQWESDTIPDLKAFCIVGVPGERVQPLDTSDQFIVNKGLAFLEVIPVQEENVPQKFRRKTSCFYGEIADELTDEASRITVESIKGMSGGPIFALLFTETGTLTATVIAIQSAWRPEERLVIGCPVKGFPEHLQEFFNSRGESLPGHP